MATQLQKAEQFRELHERDTGFVIPNPWDIGSACLLAGLGFEALATTSGGFASSVGRRDGDITREQTIRHCRELSGRYESTGERRSRELLCGRSDRMKFQPNSCL
jgi:2-methylisocitrate lyase-like PEP mutase family enzyme